MNITENNTLIYTRNGFDISFNLNNATLNDFHNNDQFTFVLTMDRLGWFFIYTQQSHKSLLDV